MREKINMLLIDLRLYLIDIAGAAASSVIFEKAMGEVVHIATTIIATVAGGSLLFLLQKTLLPKISTWVNEKMKW